MVVPTFDLNHCRSRSIRLMVEVFVQQSWEAKRVISSNACSGTVSRISKLYKASSRSASLGGKGTLMTERRKDAGRTEDFPYLYINTIFSTKYLGKHRCPRPTSVGA